MIRGPDLAKLLTEHHGIADLRNTGAKTDMVYRAEQIDTPVEMIGRAWDESLDEPSRQSHTGAN